MKRRTPQNFLKELEEKNITITAWCKSNSLSSNVAWAVIRGTVVGRSGEARRAMILMGLDLPSARRNITGKAAQKQAAAAQGAAA